MKKIFLLAIMSSFIFIGCKDDKTTTDPSGDTSALTVDRTQRSALWYYSATWCPPCGSLGNPTFKAIISATTTNEIMPLDLQAVGSALAPIYRNAQGKFIYSPILAQISDNLRLNGYIPAFTLNNNFEGNSDVNGSSLIGYANGYNDRDADAGVAVTATADGNIITINTKSKFFTNMDGEYFISLLLVEKEIIALQKVDNITDPNFVHKYIVRASAIGSMDAQVSFEALATSPSANTEIENTYTFDAITYDEGAPGFTNWEFDKENTAVAAIIWKKNGALYDTVNGIMVDIK